MHITQYDDATAIKIRSAAALTRDLRLTAAVDLEAGRKVNLILSQAGALDAIGRLVQREMVA